MLLPCVCVVALLYVAVGQQWHPLKRTMGLQPLSELNQDNQEFSMRTIESTSDVRNCELLLQTCIGIHNGECLLTQAELRELISVTKGIDIQCAIGIKLDATILTTKKTDEPCIYLNLLIGFFVLNIIEAITIIFLYIKLKKRNGYDDDYYDRNGNSRQQLLKNSPSRHTNNDVSLQMNENDVGSLGSEAGPKSPLPSICKRSASDTLKSSESPVEDVISDKLNGNSQKSPRSVLRRRRKREDSGSLENVTRSRKKSQEILGKSLENKDSKERSDTDKRRKLKDKDRSSDNETNEDKINNDDRMRRFLKHEDKPSSSNESTGKYSKSLQISEDIGEDKACTLATSQQPPSMSRESHTSVPLKTDTKYSNISQQMLGKSLEINKKNEKRSNLEKDKYRKMKNKDSSDNESYDDEMRVLHNTDCSHTSTESSGKCLKSKKSVGKYEATAPPSDDEGFVNINPIDDIESLKQAKKRLQLADFRENAVYERQYSMMKNIDSLHVDSLVNKSKTERAYSSSSNEPSGKYWESQNVFEKYQATVESIIYKHKRAEEDLYKNMLAHFGTVEHSMVENLDSPISPERDSNASKEVYPSSSKKPSGEYCSPTTELSYEEELLDPSKFYSDNIQYLETSNPGHSRQAEASSKLSEGMNMRSEEKLRKWALAHLEKVECSMVAKVGSPIYPEHESNANEEVCPSPSKKPSARCWKSLENIASAEPSEGMNIRSQKLRRLAIGKLSHDPGHSRKKARNKQRSVGKKDMDRSTISSGHESSPTRVLGMSQSAGDS